MKHVASILLVSSVSINILKDFQQTSHELFWVNSPHWQIRNFTKVILSKKQKITGRDPFYLTEIITLFSSHIVRCSQWVHDKPWKLYKGGNLKWANRKKWCLSWHEKKGVNFHENLFRGLQVADRSNQEKNLSQSKMSSLMVGIYYYIHVVIWFFFSFDMNYFVLEDYCSSLSNTQHGNLFLLKALFR